MLRTAFQATDGHEVDTAGDGFFVAFHRATDAAVAAVTAQRAIATHPWPEGVQVRVRMALHTGEPTVAAGGYVGADVRLLTLTGRGVPAKPAWACRWRQT